MFPTLQLGPLALQTPGLILLAGLWLGLWLANKSKVDPELPPAALDNATLLAILAGLLGARLTFVLANLQAFLADPWSIFSLSPALLDLWGGLTFALVAVLVTLQRQKISVLAFADAAVPLFAMLNIALPFSNLASGRGFGSPTNVPWGIELWGATRHPSQLYEMLAGLLILFAIHRLSRTMPRRSTGSLFYAFLALSSLSRLFLEAFRGDSLLLGDSIRLVQVAAWLALSMALYGLYRLLSQDETGTPLEADPP
jgi:phosphatidylglycerol---prolipoprotein diacylglyceryl transferase